MEGDDGLGSSTSGPRRSGRRRRSGDPRGEATHGTLEPSVHPLIGSDTGSPNPIDAARIGLERLQFILFEDQYGTFSTPSFQKRLDFINVPDDFIEKHFPQLQCLYCSSKSMLVAVLTVTLK